MRRSRWTAERPGEDAIPGSTGEEVEEGVERRWGIGTDEEQAAGTEGEKRSLGTGDFGEGCGIGIGGSVGGGGDEGAFGIGGDVEVAVKRGGEGGEIFGGEEGVVGAEGPFAVGEGIDGMDDFMFFGVAEEGRGWWVSKPVR